MTNSTKASGGPAAPGAPAAASAPVRPIHLPGTSALESLRRHAQTALDTWAREWVSGWAGDEPRNAPLHVESVLDEVGPRFQEYDVVRAGKGCLWFRRSIGDRIAFNCAITGAKKMRDGCSVDEWMSEVVDRAWCARSDVLCAALMGEPVAAHPLEGVGELPQSLFALGSGAVRLSCDAFGLNAIADAAVWRALLPAERASSPQPRPRLTSLERAAHRARTRLDVLLGSVDLELPQLMDLRCGDVLRLPQRLDQGIAVLCEGKTLAHALLGEMRGRKSVQLFADSSSERALR